MEWSKYSIIREIDEDNVVAINLKTLGVHILERNLVTQPFEKLSEAVKEKLIKSGLMVDEGIDEYKQVINIFSDLNNNLEVLNLMISLTDQCNLCCTYCFNQDYKKKNVIDVCKLEEQILRLKKDVPYKVINIIYTGGEPTIYSDTIVKVQEMISKHLGPTNSMVITNGTLLDGDVIEILKKVNIKSYQVTLDGPERIHNTIRYYKKSKRETFNTIVTNIKEIYKRTEHPVVLRVNLSMQSSIYINELLEELEPLKECIIIDFCKVYKSEHYYNELNKKVYEIYKLATGKGFLTNNHWKSKLPFNRTCSYYHKNSFIIDCNNEIYDCAYCKEEIDRQSNLDNVRKSSVKDINERCKNCSFLPVCMGGCTYKKRKEGMDVNCDYGMYEMAIDLLIDDIRRKRTLNTKEK